MQLITVVRDYYPASPAVHWQATKILTVQRDKVEPTPGVGLESGRVESISFGSPHVSLRPLPARMGSRHIYLHPPGPQDLHLKRAVTCMLASSTSPIYEAFAR